MLGQCLAITVGCSFLFMDKVTDLLWVELGKLESDGSSPPLTGIDFVSVTQKPGTYKVEPCFLQGLQLCRDTMRGVHNYSRVSATLTQPALPFPSAIASVTSKSLAQLLNLNANLIIYFGFRFGDRLYLSKIQYHLMRSYSWVITRHFSFGGRKLMTQRSGAI